MKVYEGGTVAAAAAAGREEDGKSAKSKSFLIYDIVRAITIFVLPLSEDELDLLGYGILAQGTLIHGKRENVFS